MSIPTFNLYDFVHQVTENRTNLFYFHPWGERNLGNIKQIINEKQIDKEQYKSIDPEYIFFKKSLPGQWYRFLPVILCHDQEPLNYDFYCDENLNNPESMAVDQEFIKKQSQRFKDFDSSILENKNLRYTFAGDWHNKWILLHSELNSVEVKKYLQTDNFVCAYWWSHAMIARDWYRYAEYDKSFINDGTYKKLFLCYSRDTSGSRQYRSQFSQLVDNVELENYCQFSSFNDNHSVTSDSSASYNSFDFKNTAISVILETVFDQRIHLTEKTLRAIACEHPFIIANGPGTLEYLKNYGFKTFSPWINEDYDKEQNADKRLQMIVQEMKRISGMSDSDQQQMLEEIRKIAKHNRQIFFGKQFVDQVISELTENLTSAVKKVEHKMDWKYRWEIYKSVLRNNPAFWNSENTPEQRKLTLTLIRHLKKGGTLENYVPPDLD